MAMTVYFDWVDELEKTVVHSLTTSFGLDFILFEDKVGGNVDTLQNVRKDIYATDKERQAYEDRCQYNSDAYHKNENYINHGKKDALLHAEGKLNDPYRGVTMSRKEKRNLDHVISAKEISDDPARILAELSGVDLANRESNLKSTHETINKSKSQASFSNYLTRLPSLIKEHEATLNKDRQLLSSLPRKTPEQLHNIQKMEDKIRKTQGKIDTLKSIDYESARKQDISARSSYDDEIKSAYYSSSKFLSATALSATSSGVRMGVRQVLGLVMAEIWFELRAQLPNLLSQMMDKFHLDSFFKSLGDTLRGIWIRVKERFSDFIEKFKDGLFAGILSDLTTTLLNMIFTTQRMAIKLIREMWGSVVSAFKVLALNPGNLSTVEVMRSTSNILALGIATVLGSTIYGSIAPALTMPYGSELAEFIGAFSTGLITLGFQYFINYSPIVRPLWDILEKSSHLRTLQNFRAINAHLDEYSNQLASTEFNMDTYELADFSDLLKAHNSEHERSFVLNSELQRRGIELPYAPNNPESIRSWLSGATKS